MTPNDTRVDVRLRQAIETGTLPKELLVCGPAGTGKTYGALSVLHTTLADYPRLRALIVRQVRASLAQSVLATFEQEVLRDDGMEHLAYGCMRGNRDSYHYPNLSELAVCGLDRPGRALSSSWDIIYVNESIELVEDGWNALTERLDRPGRPEWLGWMLGDTNPGDPSHWLKKRCDDGRTAIWDTTHRANPAMWDGREWTPAGAKYLTERLGKLTGTRRKRYLEGLWAAGAGIWFECFDGTRHISEAAEYEPRLPVHLAIDSGVYTGAVAFQRRPQPYGLTDRVTCFYDYLSEGLSARANGRAILDGLAGRTGRRLIVTTDPAGGARNPVGPTVRSEYEAAGLRTEPWPLGSVGDGLALIEAFVAEPGDPLLLVHPRCQRLITAFANYKRAKRGNQWTDRPEDPQHPHEDVMDALRGGLRAEFPDGVQVAKFQVYRPAKRVGY